MQSQTVFASHAMRGRGGEHPYSSWPTAQSLEVRRVIREFEQSLSGDRGSRNIPAEPLEPSAILAPDSHSRVQAEALYAGALLPDPRLHVLDLDAIARSRARRAPKMGSWFGKKPR